MISVDRNVVSVDTFAINSDLNNLLTTHFITK